MKVTITLSVLATLLISNFLIKAGLENRIVGNEGIISNNMALFIGVIILIFTFWRYKNKVK